MNESALGLLGLGARSRALAVGTGGVRSALQRGELALVVVACDASARTEDKVVRLAQAKDIPVIVGPPAEELGRRLGQRRSIQTVGVRDTQLAAGIHKQSLEAGGVVR